MTVKMTRFQLWALLVLLWALIYLPGLGAPEFRGEEAHRTLPAVTMLETGNWMMPYIAGEPYFNKPPGINWPVALSYLITGKENEFTSRIVSPAFILAFITLVMWAPSGFLDLAGRGIVCAVYMTVLGLVDKGRQIEIEAVYVALTAAAVLWWMNAFSLGWRGWRMWLVPGVVLGYGMLVKGPVILLFFYAVVIPVAVYTRRWRSVLSVWHGVAIVILVGMNYIWAYLGPMQYSQEEMAGTLVGDMLLRLRPKSLGYWAENIGESLVSFLPWTLFAGALWDKRLTGRIPSEQQGLYKGARLGFVIGYLAIMLMPQSETRYVLPVYGVGAILLGWALSLHDELFATDRVWKWALLVCSVVCVLTAAAGLVYIAVAPGHADVFGGIALGASIGIALYLWAKREKLNDVLRLSLTTAVIFAMVMMQFGWIFMDLYVAKTEKFRPATAAVRELAGPENTLYIYSSEYETWLFYIDKPFEHIFEPNDIDENVRYLIVEKLHRDELNELEAYRARHPKVLYEFDKKRIKGQYELLELEPVSKAAANPGGDA